MHVHRSIFGEFYQFWDKKLDNLKQDDIEFGKYITPKYSNLKQELLLNAKNAVDIKMYENIIFKSQTMMATSEYVKTLIATGEHTLYGIKAGEPITHRHILDVLLYTDLHDLSYNLRSSFESNMVTTYIKHDISEYAHWSKLLCEAVNVFGDLIDPKFTYFHGLRSRVTFPSFTPMLNRPISCTGQLSLATMMIHQGILLDFTCSGTLLKAFDCRWISRYGMEDERLFISPPVKSSNYRMRVVNIRDLGYLQPQNYHRYMDAMTILDYMMNGDASTVHVPHDEDMEYMKKLYGNDGDKYMMDMFESITNDKKEIMVNYYYLENIYKDFKGLVCDEESECMRLRDLCRVYKNCEKIISVRRLMGKTKDLVSLDKRYLKMLIELDGLKNTR